VLRALPLHAVDGLTTDDLELIVGARAIEILRTLRQLMRETLVSRTGEGKKGNPHRYYAPAGEVDD
jgi:hypothetical protein